MNVSTSGALNLDSVTGDMEISNNCKKCDCSSKKAGNLKKKTFESAFWRKIIQMQPM